MKLRFYVCIAACVVFSLTATFLITSESSGKSKQAAVTRTSKTKSKTRRTRRVSHRRDNSPANPSNCNINQPFNAGCNLPLRGEKVTTLITIVPIKDVLPGTRTRRKTRSRIICVLQVLRLRSVSQQSTNFSVPLDKKVQQANSLMAVLARHYLPIVRN